jgi:chemotaxis protein methyltransferase CheR
MRMHDDATAKAFVPPFIRSSDDMPTLAEQDYLDISQLMYQRSGVNLERNKIPMIQARLSKRLSRLGLRSYREYIRLLRDNEIELCECINALTTHKTDFFREPDHFEFLRLHVLPELLEADHRNPKKFRIWSAACSSGEEVYTIALTTADFLASHPEFGEVDYKILGTDIDTNIIARATEAIYPKDLVKPVRPDILQRYFQRGCGNNAGFYRVRSEITRLTKFRYHNLLESAAHFSGMKFQVIFLRNVLIYFKEETRQKVIENIQGTLDTGGYLFVGHSESLAGIKHQLKGVGAAIYQKA